MPFQICSVQRQDASFWFFSMKLIIPQNVKVYLRCANIDTISTCFAFFTCSESTLNYLQDVS